MDENVDMQQAGCGESRAGGLVADEKKTSTEPQRKWRTLVIAFVLLATAIAIAFVLRNERGGQGLEGSASQSFEVPIDEIAAEMIAGFEGFSFSVTNGEHIIHVGAFSAKRVSAVGGRVRVNFNATAYEAESGGRWETSILIEFSLAGEGARLKGTDVEVRRMHIYDLPKDIGNDELECDPRAVSIVKARVQSSKDVVPDSQKVVDVKLTTDDTVKISWETIK